MTRIGVTVLYLAGLAGGLSVAFKPTFDSRFAHLQTETGDAVLNHYLLEHSWRCVSDSNYCGTLLSPPFYYPAKLVLAYSENLLGAAPVYWALRLGLPEDLAYQWWMIVLSGLNFVAFAVVARWLGCNHFLTVFGAYLWAFALVHVEQAKHQQTIPRFWMPFAAYYAWQLALAPSVRSLNRLLGCVFLQATACIYTGWFLAAGVGVFIPAAVGLRPGGLRELWAFARQRRGAVLRVCGFWAATLVVWFTPYLIVNWGMARAYADCVDLMPTGAAWLTGPPGSRWSHTLARILPPVYLDCWIFSGFGLYLLVVVATVHVWKLGPERARRPELVFVAACLLTAAAWWVISLRMIGDVSLWWLFRFVPGGQAIRAIARIYVSIYLFGTLAAVVWLQVVTGRIGRCWLRALALAAVVAPVIYEQTGYEPQSVHKAEFYPLARECGEVMRGADAAYVLPVFGKDREIHPAVLAMWAGMYANVPVINGYSGRGPDGLPPGWESLSDDQIRTWLRGRVRGRVAVIDPNHPRAVRYVQVE